MITELTIDRGTWQTGRYASNIDIFGDTALLNEKDMQCCLGFLGTACGYQDEELFEVDDPSSVDFTQAWPADLFGYSGYRPAEGSKLLRQWESVFIEINDAVDVSDYVREDWIKTGFKYVLGIEVTFVNEYATMTSIELRKTDE